MLGIFCTLPILTALVGSASTYCFWNWGLVGVVEAVNEINVLQAVGMFVLAKLAGGVFRSSVFSGELCF